MKELKSLLKLYAVTPSHIGSGDTIATIDLPIQREKHTNYPIINASSIKGAFREHYRRANNNSPDINIIFGTDEQDLKDKNNEKNNPAIVSFSDSRVFAFPMRSNESPFIWVTSPYVINRFIKDLHLIGFSCEDIGNIDIKDDNSLILTGNLKESEIIIEEAVIKAKINNNEKLANLIKKYFSEADKLVLVSDEMFSYCVTCTEIQTNIKIDIETGTATDGSLRYQEFLPSETLLYNIVWFGNDKTNNIQENTVKESIKKAIGNYIQIGGDETLGKGIFNITWFDKE